MSERSPSESLLKRLDQLNEFEREPVRADRLHGGGYFAALFCGEHVAATEFVIGALFVKLGARAGDVLLGLLIGNLLAVLSWTLVCAPIAVQTRLTLYWYLRKIAGPVVTAIYNVLNAVLFAILAGAMITVSSSAVRLPLGIPPQTHWYPEDPRFVLVVLAVGAVIVVLTIAGFKRLAEFAGVCAPWMIAMFIAGGLAGLPLLGKVDSFARFWEIAQRDIWRGPAEGASGLGLWHVIAFAWICNLATHLGLSDMALFRYARHWTAGFHSAFGMYLGHYLSWICAGIMGAAASAALNRPLTELDSGSIAYTALGAIGALTVVIAGWTTANPTLYRASLALQAVTPGWPRWFVTLLVGAVTTLIACFPFVFQSLLGFVAMYGILLMPVGAIVVVEHWIFPRLGWTQFWSTRRGQLVNAAALVAWGLGLTPVVANWIAWALGGEELIHPFFLAIPVWFLTSAGYLLLAALGGARQTMPGDVAAEEAQPVVPPVPPAVERPRFSAASESLYHFCGAAALVCLALIVVAAARVLAGASPAASLHSYLIPLTVVYFIAGTLWMIERQRRHPGD